MPHDIPIVGQSAAVMHWWPTALIHCKCRGDRVLFMVVLSGFENPAACGNCGKIYQIMPQTIPGRVEIATILPAPTGTIQ